MKITDEMVEAAAREIWKADNTTLGVAPPDDMEAWENETEGYLELARVALEAALAVAPEKGDLSEIIAEVLEAHVGRLGTHYEGCWKYHAACLALLLRKAGVVAPPKNEGENDDSGY